MKKYLLLLSLSGLSLIISGCTPSTTPQPTAPSVPTQNTIQTQPEAIQATTVERETVDLSQKSPAFHSGMNDGCATAKGKYSKDSARYNSDTQYNEGWFYGRRSCQPH